MNKVNLTIELFDGEITIGIEKAIPLEEKHLSIIFTKLGKMAAMLRLSGVMPLHQDGLLFDNVIKNSPHSDYACWAREALKKCNERIES